MKRLDPLTQEALRVLSILVTGVLIGIYIGWEIWT